MSIWHWLIVLAVVALIFGTKKLGSIGHDLGNAVRGFKKAMNDGEAEEKAKQLRHEEGRPDAEFSEAAKTRTPDSDRKA